jgi:hypothetical protein
MSLRLGSLDFAIRDFGSYQDYRFRALSFFAAAGELRAFDLGSVWVEVHDGRGESGGSARGSWIRSFEAQLLCWTYSRRRRFPNDLNDVCQGRPRRAPHYLQYEYFPAGRIGAAFFVLIETNKKEPGQRRNLLEAAKNQKSSDGSKAWPCCSSAISSRLFKLDQG